MEFKALPTSDDIVQISKLAVPRVRSTVKSLFFPDPADYEYVAPNKWPIKYGIEEKQFVYDEETNVSEVAWPELTCKFSVDGIVVQYRRPNFLVKLSDQVYCDTFLRLSVGRTIGTSTHTTDEAKAAVYYEAEQEGGTKGVLAMSRNVLQKIVVQDIRYYLIWLSLFGKGEHRLQSFRSNSREDDNREETCLGERHSSLFVECKRQCYGENAAQRVSARTIRLIIAYFMAHHHIFTDFYPWELMSVPRSSKLPYQTSTNAYPYSVTFIKRDLDKALLMHRHMSTAPWNYYSDSGLYLKRPSLEPTPKKLFTNKRFPGNR